MRSLFAFIGGALVTFLGLGWYFNWYTIEKKPSDNGHARIEFDLNTKKLNEDVDRGIKAGTERLEKATQKLPQAPPAPK